MEQLEHLWVQLSNSPGMVDFTRRYKALYKEGSIWTLETGCLLFTSWMVYYLVFISNWDNIGALDIIVVVFFILGVLTYLASSSLFNKFSEGNRWVKYIKTANQYLFMILSFLPGIYFAWKFEHFILSFYLVVHLATSVYFFYKRIKDFEAEPFFIGVGMSVALYMVGPIIRGFFGIFGSSWIVLSLASTVESTVDLGLAIAFLLRLPQKHLPPNMLFGLRLVKYLMCFISWKTWFILMIFATWANLGAGAQAAVATYGSIDVNNKSTRDQRQEQDGLIKNKEG